MITMPMMTLSVRITIKKYWWWISDSDSNPSSARGSSGWARELWRKKREVEKKETWQLPERRPSNLTNPRLTHDLCLIFPDFVINQLNIRPVEVDYKIEHHVSTSNFWIPVSILLDDEESLVFGAWICTEEGGERKDGLAEEWSGQDSQVSMPELSW